MNIHNFNKLQKALIQDIEEDFDDFGMINGEAIERLQKSLYVTQNILQVQVYIETGKVIVKKVNQ